MKSLYESILDDEDVLINSTKNHVKNAEMPFYLLKQFEGKDLTKHRDEIMNILLNTRFPKLKNNVKEYEYEIYQDFIIIQDVDFESTAGWICSIRINDAFKYFKKNNPTDSIIIIFYKKFFNTNSLKSFFKNYKFNIIDTSANSIAFSI